jgi:DNA-binding HxlR family transcriptional regulator
VSEVLMTTSLPTGAFGLPRPPAMPAISRRRAQLLRLLGRLEVMFSSQIYEMLYANVTRRSMQRDLEAMRDDGLIWRTTVRYGTLPQAAGRVQPPMKYPLVYGLTPEGKSVLDALGLEPDVRSLETLKTRDPRGRRVPTLTLTHDLQVSWWCASILMAARASPLVQSVFAQVEFTTHSTQRLDALVILRVCPSRPRAVDGQIPWFDGAPCPPDTHEVKLGLEVDMATEPLSQLLDKAIVTRDLTASGRYTELFGGPIRTVFLAPTPRRAAQIAAEWADAWPETWGVVSTPRGAEHPAHGALWGDYRLLRDGATAAPLLAELLVGGDGRVRERVLCALDAWERTLVR